MPSAMESSRPVRSLKRNVFERDAPEFRAMRKSRYLKHGCGVENIGLCRCVSLLPNAPGFTPKRRLAMLYQKWYISGVNDGTIETDSLGFLEIRRRSRAGAGNELPREDQRTIGHDIARVQFGLPVCRPMGKGLWEVRSSLPSKREARVLFGFHDGMLIALTAFIKKKQTTPAGELALAQQRWKEVTA
jgi:phage-related protein